MRGNEVVQPLNQKFSSGLHRKSFQQFQLFPQSNVSQTHGGWHGVFAPCIIYARKSEFLNNSVFLCRAEKKLCTLHQQSYIPSAPCSRSRLLRKASSDSVLSLMGRYTVQRSHKHMFSVYVHFNQIRSSKNYSMTMSSSAFVVRTRSAECCRAKKKLCTSHQ